jgi:GAF domain-containing protein
MALRSYRILDTDFDPAFDRTTELAKTIFNVPIAVISLVDSHRQWFKSVVGLDCRETCRNVAFCAYAIKQTKPLVVYDATQDDRFKENTLVTGAPFIKFYAGAQLQTSDNFNIGTLCIIDTVAKTPEEFGEDKKKILVSLAQGVVRELELFKSMTLARSSETLYCMFFSFVLTF